MIAVELKKQLPRPRTWLTLAALAAFPAVMTLALIATGSARPESVGDVPLVIVPSSSGFTISLLALSSTMKFFLPLGVSIFAGEAVAGEIGWGSLRYALARGISRSRLLASKAAVAAALSLAAVLLVPLAALAAGGLAFGWHPLQEASATFSAGETLLRLCVATGYVAAGMASIFAFAFFLSTVSRRPLVAVAGGVGLTVLSRVLNADYLPGVAALSGYLPNNDVDLWVHLFQRPAQTDGMTHFLVLQAVYAVVFLGLAWWWFNRRDVLT